MKKAFYGICLSLVCVNSFAQDAQIDSLRDAIGKTANDTLQLQILGTLADIYTEIRTDSALYYAEQELGMAKKLQFKLNECYALQQMGYALMNLGNYAVSLRTHLSAITIAEDPASENNILPDKYVYGEDLYANAKTPHLKRLDKIARMHLYVGILYGNAFNYEKEKLHYLQSRAMSEITGNVLLASYCDGVLSRAYLYLNMHDSALLVAQKAYEESERVSYRKYQGSILLNFARVHAAMHRQDLAIEYYRKALAVSREYGYLRGMVASNLALADIYLRNGLKDSSFFFTQEALKTAEELKAPTLLVRSYNRLVDYFRTSHVNDSVVKYQDLVIQTNDSVFNAKQAQVFQGIDFDEQQRQQKKAEEDKAYLNRLKMYGLLAGLTVLLIIATILWRNNQHRRKAYALLQKQKQETDTQRMKAEQTLVELKNAQGQLIQSEKMASLGELTAGIAHEIQNPLNFVNNFSDINGELIDELKAELEAGNSSGVTNILEDIRENAKKINQHGKRADTIVKGMLQHSRVSSGQKELTDLNAMAEEYLRLSYHGLRAKQKNFQSRIETSFDGDIGRINIVPQDIGRVLLNLYNNAFYAVSEKMKSQTNGFEPLVSVSTKKIPGKIQICVRDNGNGIPEKIMDKIFQPFFTTKPAGQGTGLGLSQSYDMVKAHGGEIRVDSGVFEGASFVIELPNA
ncbi:MAG: ATP-binding protein [Chitinophagales bacterium]